MIVVGITGGIGSGKSAVTGYLESKGFPVIDADVLSRQLAEPGQEGHAAMVGLFGRDALLPSGKIDRKFVADRVFSDEGKRLELNKAIHAMVKARAGEMIENCRRAGADVVFLSAPLLFESGMDSQADRVWLVDAEESVRLERVIRRDDAKEEDVRKRMRAQMDSAEKRKRAHAVIDNSGSLEELRQKIDELL